MPEQKLMEPKNMDNGPIHQVYSSNYMPSLIKRTQLFSGGIDNKQHR